MAVPESLAKMMEDHFIICRARNALADALKTLLKAEVMTADDFRKSREHAMAALESLNDLLRFVDRQLPKS